MKQIKDASVSVATVEIVLSSSESESTLEAPYSKSGKSLEDIDDSALREGVTRTHVEVAVNG